MKINIIKLLSLFIITPFLFSCSTSSSSNLYKQKQSIKVNSPITLSNNDLSPYNGSNHYLRLKLIDGTYQENWEIEGSFWGPKWIGKFIVELSNENGATISLTDINQFFKDEKLSFNSQFNIEFDDYNSDGNLDFTIGQHGSDFGNNYKIFSIDSSGHISELRIKDEEKLFISNTTGKYSTLIERMDGTTFKIQFFDEEKSKLFESVYEWNGSEFNLFDTYEIES